MSTIAGGVPDTALATNCADEFLRVLMIEETPGRLFKLFASLLPNSFRHAAFSLGFGLATKANLFPTFFTTDQALLARMYPHITDFEPDFTDLCSPFLRAKLPACDALVKPSEIRRIAAKVDNLFI
jgi:hypothetical protein